ncbi:MAG: phosphodiester glycosidase family protein [Aphanocapsa sp. GSE-SYN-MK-11-07L]|jgi:hypothetical protein|nr:phosphodiester glycosidase family protein [Aphanocapsa sp. GSE-SYN-MK-11-07L]
MLKRRSRQFVLNLLITAILSLPIVWYGFAQWSRPPRSPAARSLFEGIRYERQVLSVPRPVMVHIVAIDLAAPSVRPFVTPGFLAEPWWGSNSSAMTVTEFVAQFKLQVAINANFFHPFMENKPWDFYPDSGDPVHNIGQATSNGLTYSRGKPGRPAICFLDHNRVQMVAMGLCPKETQQAVAGKEMLVEHGQIVQQSAETLKGDKSYPRSLVAIDQSGQKLWLIAVDGKQFEYSEGLKLTEMADFVLKLGADAAINLDGGGSVTLAVQALKEVKVLNAPIQTRIPMRERPVSNQLGFFANPLPSERHS